MDELENTESIDSDVTSPQFSSDQGFDHDSGHDELPVDLDFTVGPKVSSDSMQHEKKTLVDTSTVELLSGHVKSELSFHQKESIKSDSEVVNSEQLPKQYQSILEEI